jgi:pimeloyl-ACP methyl ester carboxylesterase
MPPETKYAKSGDINIAYQVVGDAPIDLVYVAGWVSHLDYFWEEPSYARFLRRLASFSRLILLDKRGTGLSDRVAELPTIEERMDDVRAVLDAVGSERAALVGLSEGGPMCTLFAATYPERTSALVMIGCYARRLWAPDYPWGATQEESQSFLDQIERGWGGPVALARRAPSLVTNERFRQWWATYLRMSVSPGAALALTRMNFEIDAGESSWRLITHWCVRSLAAFVGERLTWQEADSSPPSMARRGPYDVLSPSRQPYRAWVSRSGLECTQASVNSWATG